MFSAKEIITSQIKPALGCTEPAAIALNAAYLKEYCNEKEIELTINTNLLKNAMYVPIPNTNRKFGVKFAFALGFLCGKKEKGLNIFEDLTKDCIKKAQEFEKNINLKIIEGNDIYIKSKTKNCEVLTKDFHDNIVYVKTPKKTLTFEKKASKNDTKEIEKWLKNQPFEKLYDMLNEDFSFLKEAIETNLKLAKRGLQKNCGLDINKTFDTSTIEGKILAYTTAASDARMEGEDLPAMSVFGSGNHGIAAIIPPYIYAKEKNFPEEKILKAVALSILITIYIKLFIGRLSPICGAAFASGCASAAAIAWLEKGKKASIKAISVMIETISGIICDGAKMGCSLKVMIGTKTAYKAAMLAINDIPVFDDGILEKDITKTIQNLEKITKAMKKVDPTITDIMKNKLS